MSRFRSAAAVISYGGSSLLSSILGIGLVKALHYARGISHNTWRIMTINTSYRVRFAPSPTGHVHLGSARTALYDYLIAKQTQGQFILRIEDTDRKRLVEGAEDELVDSLHWLGIDWDEGPDKGGAYGPYRQSERKEIYLKYARELIDKDAAYYCFCSAERLNQVSRKSRKTNCAAL